MDCQTAIEYINLYADNMLGKKETEQLLSHISSCSKCKKDLDDILAVKKALGGLGEMKPPAGLALSAIKKAKKRKVPVYAYASGVIAAVIALAVIISSNLFGNNYGETQRDKAANPAAYSQALTEDDGTLEECAREPVTFDMAPAPEPNQIPPEENGNTALGGTREASVPYVTVPADVSEDFRKLLVDFLAGNNIEYKSYVDENLDTISFTITEDKLDDLRSLIDEHIEYEGKLNAGYIEFIFNK